jgi:hypothetical protein
MEITGVSEPEARISPVRRSLSLEGTEWHRMTRSKSPARKRWAASFTEDADSTRYPAERMTMFRFLSNDASRPTERTRVSGMGSPNSGCVKLARLTGPLGDSGGLDRLEFVGGSEGDSWCDLVLRADRAGLVCTEDNFIYILHIVSHTPLSRSRMCQS